VNKPRECSDCERRFWVRPESKKTICPVCEADLEAQGIKNHPQPVDKSDYRPRFDGMRPFKE
jgi:hypothetical protein